MLKLGKLAPKYDPGAVHFGEYASLAPAPATVKAPVLSWGMLGNDVAGDCVWAGADHETMLWTAEAHGHVAEFTAQDALSDYGAVTGYPKAGDNGTVTLDALKYRRTTGLLDATGKRHKLGAYVSVEPGHVDHVKQAVHLFGVVGIGIQFPGSAMDQFNAGKPWSVVPGSRIEGGHYIPIVGYDHAYAYVVTWGKTVRMTWGFFAKYCDEAYALLSPEYLNGGRSPAGFNLAQLTADLKAV